MSAAQDGERGRWEVEMNTETDGLGQVYLSNVFEENGCVKVNNYLFYLKDVIEEWHWLRSCRVGRSGGGRGDCGR